MTLRIAIAGLGAIGAAVARRLDAGIEGLSLTAVAGRDLAKTAAAVGAFRARPEVMAASLLGEVADVVVDCAPGPQLGEIAEVGWVGREEVEVSSPRLHRLLALIDGAGDGVVYWGLLHD